MLRSPGPIGEAGWLQLRRLDAEAMPTVANASVDAYSMSGDEYLRSLARAGRSL
jgi:hypothetical protein